MLREIDPDMAERLHPNDKVRVVRALEVYELTGKTLSWLQRQPPKTTNSGRYFLVGCG